MAKFKLALIIDDNEMDNFVIRAMVERVKLAEKIQASSSACHALEFIQSLNPKTTSGELDPKEICIFLDVLMPFMDGEAFLKALVKIWPSLVQSVYVLSALPLEEQELHIKVEGVAGFIVKPLTEDKILELFYSPQESGQELVEN